MAEEQENNLSINADEKVGSYLRRVREARGINLDSMAKSIRLSKSIVEAIEENRWSDFRTEAYLRSYIISICEKLLLDKEEVIRKFSLEVNSHFSVTQSNIMGDSKSEKDSSGSNAAAIAIIAVLVVIAVLFFGAKAITGASEKKTASRAGSQVEEEILFETDEQNISDSLAQSELDAVPAAEALPVADVQTANPNAKDTLRFECTHSPTDSTCGVSLKGYDSKMNYFKNVTYRYLNRNDTIQLTITVPNRTKLFMNRTRLEYGVFNTLIFYDGKLVNKYNRDLR